MFYEIKEILIMIPFLDSRETPWVSFFVVGGARSIKGALRYSTPCSKLNFN